MKPFASLLLLTLLVVSCNQRKIPEDFDYGKVENHIYANKYFDFELPVPASWVVQSKEQMQQMNQEGQKMLEEKNKSLAAEVKASDISSASLLVAFKNRTDSAQAEFNCSFSVIAENLRGITAVKTGADYLAQAKKLMQQSGISYQYPSEVKTVKLGNHDFDVMDVIMTLQGTDVHQLYYATVEKGFALSAIASFTTDDQQKQLDDILQGFRFH